MHSAISYTIILIQIFFASEIVLLCAAKVLIYDIIILVSIQKQEIEVQRGPMPR